MKNSKALVTLAVGDLYTKMGSITHPLMHSYARRCGVDFIVFGDRKVYQNYGLDERYEKFQLYELIDKYDQIAFVDTDILISPNAPNVFDVVPEGQFAASSETGFSKANRDVELTQRVLGKVQWRNPYFNSGFMVFGKSHKELFDPTRPELTLWSTGEFRKNEINLLNDQPYLNHRLNDMGIELLDLGYKYNHTRVRTDTHTRFKSYMIHYAGPSGHRYGSRLEQLQKDYNVLTSPKALQFSTRYPAWRWAMDRIDVAFLRYLLKDKLFSK